MKNNNLEDNPIDWMGLSLVALSLCLTAAITTLVYPDIFGGGWEPVTSEELNMFSLLVFFALVFISIFNKGKVKPFVQIVLIMMLFILMGQIFFSAGVETLSSRKFAKGVRLLTGVLFHIGAICTGISWRSMIELFKKVK
ncbi:MAG TPA: hypothetical protein VGE63_01810 [Candidatus Paceibacterota bacterium]